MGLAAVGALVAILLAFLAQSPRLLSRLKLTGQRLDLRARALTGYGLALLLLAMGFFLAGVPLDANREQIAAETTELPGLGSAVATELAENEDATGNGGNGSQSGAMIGLPSATPGGASGAMGDLITPQATLEPGDIITGTIETTAEAVAPPAATDAPPAATATRAPTVTPTSSPTPTPTATPILVPTARINDETSTLPVRRLPNGPVLVVLTRGDTVIPRTGNAFHGGEVWKEIQTVDGVIGWVPERFLDYEE